MFRHGNILCDITGIDEDDRIEGWLWDPDASGRPIVQIMAAGIVLAEAVADTFEPELLAAGLGHGHHAFSARIRSHAPAGTHGLTLWYNDQQMPIPAMSIVISEADMRQRTLKVDDLISQPPSWTLGEILDNLDVLCLEANLARMGPERFVEASCAFVLGRWASEEELSTWANELQREGMTATELFVMLATSGAGEGNRRSIERPSPHDSRFPFDMRRMHGAAPAVALRVL